MFILASTPYWSDVRDSSVELARVIQYDDREWYEVIDGIRSYRDACKRAEIYYHNFASTGGIPLVVEKHGQFSVCVDAARFSDPEFLEHIQAARLCVTVRNWPLHYYSRRERAAFYYPLKARPLEKVSGDSDTKEKLEACLHLSAWTIRSDLNAYWD